MYLFDGCVTEASLVRMPDSETNPPLSRLRAAAALTMTGALLVTCSTSQPQPSPSATSEPTAPSAPETPAATAPVWIGLTMPDPRPDEHQGESVLDAVAGGPGFVAVGQSSPCCGVDLRENNSLSAAVWTSVDGIVWQSVDTSAMRATDLHDVAAGPDGRLLAIGATSAQVPAGDEPSPGVGMWRSDDGVAWEPAPGPDANLDFAEVVTTDDRWVVIGGRRTPPNTYEAVVLSSSDLQTWQVEVLPGGGRARGVAVDASGRVLITGLLPGPDTDGESEAPPEPRGWVGRSGGWEVIELPADGVPMALGDAFVILDEHGLSWHSTDGRTWSGGEPGPELLRGDVPVATIRTAAATSDGLVVGGSEYSTGEELPAVWRSTDGVRWSPVETLPLTGNPHETHVEALIETAAGLVALGSVFYDKPELKYDWPDAAAWVWR